MLVLRIAATMLGPQNNKLPLNGAPSNCLKLQTDFKMKIKTEYTEEEEEEEEEEEDLVEETVDYTIISNVKSENDTFTNLEPPNDAYNDNKDSISICNMSVKEESSPSNEIFSNGQFKNKAFTNLENSLPNYTNNDTNDFIPRCKISKKKLSRSSNTKHVYKVKNKNCGINHFIKSEIVDTYENDESRLEAEIRLEDAFRDCIIEMSNDLSIEDEDIFNNILEQLSVNGSTTETNHKRKILLSDDSDTDHCSYVIQKEHSYFDKTKKPKTIKKIKDNRTYFYDESPELEIFKKTLKSFLQKSICLSLPPKIDKCIECRVFQLKNDVNNRDYDTITCRFYAFRQLRFTKSGKLAVAGYPDPFKNIDKFEMGMWLPGQIVSAPSRFNIEASTKILEDAGGQFCKFVKDEIEALKLNLSNDGKKGKIVWKKCVNGVREMCDVCRTTIFNHHWSCGKCGFVVCVDCFRAKLKGTHRTKYIQRNFNKKIWLLCSNQEEHQVENLSITQILAGDALKSISEQMHNICHHRNIPLGCSCNEKLENVYTTYPIDPTEKLLNIANEPSNSDDADDDAEETSEMQDIIKRGYLKYLKSKHNTKNEDSTSTIVLSTNKICEVECSRAKEFFTPKLSLLSDAKNYSAPHMWLCEGNLLHLLDPKSDLNYTIFQDQWKRGQPVLVSDVGNKLSSSLWHPESFTRDFGNHINDLIDCTTSRVISDQPMSKFWNGFENAEERLCDKQGSVMLLKLKDWPPSADFAETLPDRFQDLMNCLPLKEYTHRNGKYNLASRLPECFVRPDLGPKMYTAYGNAGIQHNKVGTTNLHLDISDAVNVMVYVAITKNCKEFDYDWHVREAFKVIEEAGCDDLTKRRCYLHGETPGALWHIYHASDADSIRDLLIKVAVEHGTPMEEFSDPIHDQSQYLDEYLRERLYKEYGVKGYTIVQYYGDAIFIPAGAPHQVRNLHNCIKVAEDFVSPENVHHSFHMTQEFRHLTDSHTNHEDKLQIKNIVFHAVKDSISVLMHSQQNDL